MSWRPPKEPFYEVRRSKIQGRGAFAVRRIRKGTRIDEYTGEHITDEEGDTRYDDSAMGRHHTFLFSLDDGTVVDGAVNGNDSIYINHSCAPNCEAIIEDGHIYIEALRTIEPGEELAYDYAYERTDAHTAEDEKLYACRCGAPNCRGSILAPPKPKKLAKKKAGAKRKAKGTPPTRTKSKSKSKSKSRSRNKARSR